MASFNQTISYTVDGVAKTKTIAKNTPAGAHRALLAEEPTAVIVSTTTTPRV
jgi:hypothetical protein